MSEKVLTYKDSGVDIDAGDSMVDRIRHLCQRTHSTRVVGQYGAFAGLFRLDYPEKLFRKNYKDPVLIACTDGVGTKVKIAAALKKYDTVGIDCVAMNVNDLIVQGGEPLFFLDYLAVHALDPAVTTQMVKGISDGCMEAGCSLLGGETAEMPAVYAAGEFDMAGFAVGVVDRSKMLDRRMIEAGDSVIGLASSGLHSNGYALVRKVVEKTGRGLEEFIPEFKCTLGEELLRPTRIYVKTVQKILARYKVKKVVKAMAHITGSGLPGNVPRVLPEGFSVRLKRDAWEPHPVFAWVQKNGPVDLDEMFNVFNMGIGFVMIVRPTFTKPIMSALRALGERPAFLGKVRKADGEPRVEWS
ncbi:MAG TPA: phosphoribosylformylglycinamidine cyclo-ligase [Phycisphaerae bacterium]|jgi:phosphoribosylformylglycinamidine cyclo-ligase|nr:phosphoribosylformylglycinamidine cyclo-ligase [Phycisphaerae bacterium]